jgi:hypothetical protein
MKRSFLALWGRRLRYGVYALLALVGLLALAWVVFYEFFFRPAIFRAMLEEMTDVRLERIALEEARRRAPFPICLPTWLPEGLEEPEIAFHSEWGAPLGGGCHPDLPAAGAVGFRDFSGVSSVEVEDTI